MARVQLALNVSDLDAAIRFYETLFQTPPHKVERGYANFAVADPPLKLVLIEGEGRGGDLNHLGVEVPTPGDVGHATGRLAAAGLVTDTREAELCCHAVQDKVWVDDPDGARWEVYTILDDGPRRSAAAEASACC